MSIKIILAVLLAIHLLGIVSMVIRDDTHEIFAASITSLFLGAMLWSLSRNKRKTI